MKEKLRGLLVLAALAALAVAAFHAARHWQTSRDDYVRVAGPVGCDLRAGPCRQPSGDGAVSLTITPRDIPLMQPLHLTVMTENLEVRAAQVVIRGLNMDMGLNLATLKPTGDGRWEGETILPVCSQRRMEWEAAVRLDLDRRLEVPFTFHTLRP